MENYSIVKTEQKHYTHSLVFKPVIEALKLYYAEDDVNKLEDVVSDAALVAAVACGVGSAIPILSLPGTIVGCIGAVWAMYIKICTTLRIKISDNILRFLAKAALSNVLSQILGIGFVILTGGITGAIGSAIFSFVSIFLAGIIFLQLIVKMAEKSLNPYTFSDIDRLKMEKMIKEIKISREDIANAKAAYSKANIHQKKRNNQLVFSWLFYFFIIQLLCKFSSFNHLPFLDITAKISIS